MTTSADTDVKDPDRRYIAFIDYVQDCCRQPGLRADLRSGLRREPEQANRMHRLLLRWLPSQDRATYQAVERPFYAVASMIASQSRAGRDDERERRPGGDPAAGTGLDSDAAPESSAPATQPSGDASAALTRGRGRSLGRSLAELEARTRVGRPQAKDENGADRAPVGPLSPIERRLQILSRQTVDGLCRQLPAVVLRLRDERIEVDWVQLLKDLVVWPRQRDRVTKRWMQDFYWAAPPSALADDPSSDLSPSPEGSGA